MTTIIEALQKLDTDNDDHWTANGLPLLTKVEELTGKDVSREDINKAARGYTRANPFSEPQESNTSTTGSSDPAASTTDESAEVQIDAARQATIDAAEAFERARREYEASRAELADAIAVAAPTPAERRAIEAQSIKEYQRRSLEERIRQNAAMKEAVARALNER